MPYIGAGIQRFNTADGLTVNGNAEVTGTTALTGNATAAGTLDVTGAITSSAGATITTDDNNPQLILKSTDADANSGPILHLLRDSASPADDDVIGQLKYIGKNDAAEEIVYGKVDVVITDASDGTEDAEMRFLVATEGSNPNLLKLGSTATVFNDSSNDIDFRVESDNKVNAFFIQGSDGNVGIGTGTPDKMLTLEANNNATGGSPNNVLRFKDSDTETASSQPAGAIEWHTADTDNSGPGVVGKIEAVAEGTGASYGLIFYTGNVGNFGEQMRINSGGNLLVGKTSAATSTAGVQLASDGRVEGVVDGGEALRLNRITSDGDIAVFRKDNSEVGSIGTNTISSNSRLRVGDGDVHLMFRPDIEVIQPANSTGVRDNAIDLGNSAARFDDIFATNTSIQTSDQNEKEQIASLTTAEITAAKAISKLFKTYKWKDKVAAKGDAARTHTGVIAQEVQAAMTDAGLNAAHYAFWCSDTWWETSTDVPAVEGVAEVLDDDGNVVTEAVEARDAYTRVDTYETADEAPEGATERTRLGVRYPELLAFIGAATEQRLADIETRLTALEDA